MSHQHNWPTAKDQDGWMRQIEKRMMQQERRPNITQASDLLGPGFGPFATYINDWNDDGAAFTGSYYSTANDSIHSPDDTLDWVGQCVAVDLMHGIQRAYSYNVNGAGGKPFREFIRRFYDPGAGLSRAYTGWFEIV